VVVEIHLNRLDKAIEYSKRGLSSPYAKYFHSNMGYLYLLKDALDLAIASFDTALMNEPQYVDGLLFRAMAHLYRSDFRLAHRDLKELFFLTPRDPTIRIVQDLRKLLMGTIPSERLQQTLQDLLPVCTDVTFASALILIINLLLLKNPDKKSLEIIFNFLAPFKQESIIIQKLEGMYQSMKTTDV
jgi:tetratricopeptide (TPR) repeat protein